MTTSGVSLDEDVYRRNPFRLMGIPTGSTLRQIKRRAGNLLALLGAGDTESMRDQVIGRFAGLPDEPGIRAASGRLESPAERLLDELLWFQFDDAEDPCLALLRAGAPGDVVAAVSAWQEAEESTDPDDPGPATHNLAIFHHLLAIELEKRIDQELRKSRKRDEAALRSLREEVGFCWQAALARWRHLLPSKYFRTLAQERGQTIGKGLLDAARTSGLAKEIERGLLALSGRLMLRALEQDQSDDAQRLRKAILAAGFDAALLTDVLLQLAEPVREAVHRRIESFSSPNSSDKHAAGPRAKELVAELGPKLTLLDRLAGTEDRALADLHEAFASAANVAQVMYYDVTDDAAFCLEILFKIWPDARSDQLKKTIDGNINALRCFFCAERAVQKGAGTEVKIFKINSVNPLTGSVEYSSGPITLPCCGHRDCKRSSKLATNHPILREAIQDGWRLGSEPSEQEVRAYIDKNVSPELRDLLRRMGRL